MLRQRHRQVNRSDLALGMFPDLLGQFFDLFGFLQHRNR